MTPAETDYLVVGAGAMGMAFTDELVRADRSAHVTLVDRRDKPGGHWNDAYPYVTLHQPAAFYGISSMKLGTGGGDLSTRSEILAYYERALARLQRTGRVEFIRAGEHLGDGRIRLLLDDSELQITARRRLVDATYMDVEIPSTHPPRFEVDPAVELIPPNGLTRLRDPRRRYVIVGSGKTGGDAVVYLLDRGVAPERIQWISPNEMWLWNRAVVQPRQVAKEMIGQLEAVAQAETLDEVFLRLEAKGSIWRLDGSAMPAKWRCATFDQRELGQLRKVEDIVRAGHVTSVTSQTIAMERGEVPLQPGSIVINCTANGLARRDPVPIYEPGRPGKITLQSIYECQQVLSAAAVGRLEASRHADEVLNAAIRPVTHPEWTEDFPQALVGTATNSLALSRLAPFWFGRNRLHGMAHSSKPRFLWAYAKSRALLPAAAGAAGRFTA